MNLNHIYCGDCLEVLKTFPDECIDLTVTSPPYDNLRRYGGYTFDFEGIAKELYRVTKNGGVVVWIVSDQTRNGSESGTSFRQALYYMEIGFSLNDTMIWRKESSTDTGSLKVRYGNAFEYMFVFSKGRCKTFNPIKDKKNKYAGSRKYGTVRLADGSFKSASSKGKMIPVYGQRLNVWDINTEKNNKTGHPAVFPEKLATDHILSWSNKGDVVLDCFSGSGTTCVSCIKTGRNYVGIEINEEYVKMAERRISNVQLDLDL